MTKNFFLMSSLNLPSSSLKPFPLILSLHVLTKWSTLEEEALSLFDKQTVFWIIKSQAELLMCKFVIFISKSLSAFNSLKKLVQCVLALSALMLRTESERKKIDYINFIWMTQIKWFPTLTASITVWNGYMQVSRGRAKHEIPPAKS